MSGTHSRGLRRGRALDLDLDARWLPSFSAGTAPLSDEEKRLNRDGDEETDEGKEQGHDDGADEMQDGDDGEE